MTSTNSTSVSEASDDRWKNAPEPEKSALPVMSSRYALRDLLNTIFRERWLIVWIFLLTFGAGLFMALRLEPMYTAQARVLILPSREYALNPDVGSLNTSFILGDERIVRSETEILKNTALTEQVIEDIGLKRLYPDIDAVSTSLISLIKARISSWFPDNDRQENPASNAADDTANKPLSQAVARFIKKLEILPVKDASVVYLSFSHPDPELATSALNHLLLAYLDFRTDVLTLPRSKIFIEQRDNFAQRLGKLEQDIETFKLQHDISAFTDQKSLLLRQQAEINNNKLDTETRLQEIEGRIVILKKQLLSNPQKIPLYSDNTAQDSADTARSTLVTLETRRNELLTKFNESSKFIIDIDEQIAKLRRVVDSSPPKKSDSQRVGRNPLYDEINMDLARQESTTAALRAKLISLEQQLRQVTMRLTQFDQLEKEFNTLTLERELLEKNLRTYAQKAEEALVQEEIDRQRMANVRIIEQPQVPQGARSLKMAVAIFALLGAIILALILAFFKDFFRQVLISPEDTERALGLPVLVAVPLKDNSRR